MTHRVVVTGVGVFCSIGSTAQEFWKNCLDGHTHVREIPQHWCDFASYKSDIWSPLPQIDEILKTVSRADRLHYDPVSLIALLATQDALTSANLAWLAADRKETKWEIEGIDSNRAGIFMGTGLGGGNSFLSNFSHHALDRTKQKLSEVREATREDATSRELAEIINRLQCPQRFSPFTVSMLMQNAVSAILGVKFSIKGPNVTHSVACASGTVAIGNAFRAIESGTVDIAIAGGSEYVVDEYGAMFRGYDIAGTLVHDYDNAETANRPFDIGHSGFLYSQGGAGVLILESYELAKARGAKILGELVGFEQSFDAHSMMSIEEEGSQIERMIRRLIKNANIDINEVDYINTHGTGTENNDRVESNVLSRIFKQPAWINSTKSLLGHTLGASGAIEAAVTVLTLANQVTHVCKNLEIPISDLNFVQTPHQKIDVNIGLTQSFAFGGHNAALLIRRA